MLKEWRLFAPAISGFGMSSFCGIIEGGESLPQKVTLRYNSQI